MPFKYHPPTRAHCQVCEELSVSSPAPIIDVQNGKASAANNFPFHNWYSFVLGYTPLFPAYMIHREGITESHFVVDPFVGSGTTLIECKLRGIPSAGVDANDYFVDAARVKLNWSVDVNKVKQARDTLLESARQRFQHIDFCHNSNDLRLPIHPISMSAKEYAAKHRPKLLKERYISDESFTQAHIIKELISEQIHEEPVQRLFRLALASILVPISNVRYGPGFGVVRPRKNNVDVLKLFTEKIDRMVADLATVTDKQRETRADVYLGDSRNLSDYFSPNSVDFMITSPPYPGDHEYTKHSRLELLFMGYANDLADIRRIKQRMIRGSTTNIYRHDDDSKYVRNFESIQAIVDVISRRLKEDGATSGFEKLYTKLVWEYFGGMYRVLRNVHEILKPHGKITFLVSDSHAFKMVHIQTAKILAEIGKAIGYSEYDIVLWQDKMSTSHKYNIKENILTLVK